MKQSMIKCPYYMSRKRMEGQFISGSHNLGNFKAVFDEGCTHRNSPHGIDDIGELECHNDSRKCSINGGPGG